MKTPKDALMFLLARPLQFGNGAQIEALEILRLAESFIGIELECDDCGGSGEDDDAEPGHCDRCGRECSCCSDVSYRCRRCKGTGSEKYTRDAVYSFTVERLRIMAQARTEAAAA